MYYLLFTFYLVILTWFVIRIPFVKKTGLLPRTVVLLFLIKIAAGLAIGWISHHFYPKNDYWLNNELGIDEYGFLMHDQHEFFTNIFKSPYEHAYGGYFNAVGSYWNDLSRNVILKVLAFCDIFSRGNFYINTLFFNFLGFFGPVALFNVFKTIYPERKLALIVGCFLLPSTLYYSSALGKDLVVFTMLGLYCYNLYFSITEKLTVKRALMLILSFVVILLMRNFVAVSLIPVSIAFIISTKKKANPLLVFTAVYASILILLFAMELLTPSFEPLKVVTQRRSDFLDLPGGSQLHMGQLDPSLKSFAINIPEAIDHAFLRPYLWDLKNKFVFPLAVELLLYELLFLLVILKFRSNVNSRHPFIVFSFFFAVIMLLVTGYIIPNTGSIVRYRSIYFPFLITPLLCSVLFKTNKHIKL